MQIHGSLVILLGERSQSEERKMKSHIKMGAVALAIGIILLKSSLKSKSWSFLPVFLNERYEFGSNLKAFIPL